MINRNPNCINMRDMKHDYFHVAEDALYFLGIIVSRYTLYYSIAPF